MKYSIFQTPKAQNAIFFDNSDIPIRSELFSIERLEQQAEILAAHQQFTNNPDTGRPLAPLLRYNAKVLTDAYKAIQQAFQRDEPITPAAEWLLDNFHIVEEQTREILDDLPAGFYRLLPKLTDGFLEGYPRVFGIAWDIVAHTDSGFDQERLFRFVTAYQRVQALTIGELWAIAIMLRLTLVENLKRLAQSIVSRHAAYQRANAVADRMIGLGGQNAEPIETVLESLGDAPLSQPFAVQLSLQLRDQDQRIIPALRWLDERLAAQGTTPDKIVQQEHQIQGAMNLSVRNVITSMRLISALDWPEFVESVSLVDVTLRAGSDFAAMDFPTRDLYRRLIEELALGSGKSERYVAEQAINATKKAEPGLLSGDKVDRRRDPGYYLISRGRQAFETQLGYRAPFRKWLARGNAALGVKGYLGFAIVATAIVLALGLFPIAHMGIKGWSFLCLAALAVIPASDLAFAILNQTVINRFGPAILPGLELSEGVPADLRTIVVMPTLLTSVHEVEALIKHLEVHFLSSSEGEIYFALLSDWTDSDSETAIGDDTLLFTALEGIAELNRRYGPGLAGQRFFLFHRKRVWNEGQRRWIGWERKRGKLHELNRLLRGATDTTFIPVGGNAIVVPPDVRYVITLDSDTRLPRGAARRLIGKMAHTLNRPRMDPEAHRVVDGHGLLQPRVTPSLPMGRGGSLFQRAFSGANGLDSYAFAVSDIYQDLFEEGSYVGKGIYDVDCFESALHGRIPENTVLSHDLLEGIFTRAALASDIELVEEFPSRYDVAAARQHRWVRGDWQLLPWIFARGREKGAHRKKAVVPLIGRWKMFDNLRRSLSPPAATFALLYGWCLRTETAVLWTLFIVSTILLPLILPSMLGLIPRRIGISKRAHLRGIGEDVVRALIQAAFLIIFLAHQAWVMVDAIVRTFFRMIVGRRLLEWTTAAQASTLRSDWRIFSMQMLSSIAFAVISFLFIHSFPHGSWPIALPFLLLWGLSPWLARWASERPSLSEYMPVSVAERRELRLVARRTWRFFEVFITSANNMLPPDNFQEDPHPVVANRTSPTNIGLYLLSIFVARDFGWQAMLHTVERLEATFASIVKMERFRGHLYNWYDTHDLRPLDPKYISSVDSGNMAGHLIAVVNSCKEMIRGPIIGDWSRGIEDALNLARESLKELDKKKIKPIDMERLGSILNSINPLLDQPSANLIDVADSLKKIASIGEQAANEAIALTAEIADNEASQQLTYWIEALRACVASHQCDLDMMAPWAALMAHNPDMAAGERLAESNRLTLDTLPSWCERLIGELPPDGHAKDLAAALKASAKASKAFIRRLTSLAETADMLYSEMGFGFLFDEGRQLLSIGYQVTEDKLDDSYYDLLASEARLASFVAIAKGDLPPKHWFRLGRTLTPVHRGSALISWSGSMFEYLMPALVMRAPAGSLLEHTNGLIVQRQISFGAELGVPWGVSESQYNARDLEFTYQYLAFGIPDLGYKRGLTENAVIAPYATGLAAMVDPSAAARNFKRLTDEGGRGVYGWYEALDYTPERLPEGAKVAVIRAYMAHHQAMSLVGIANALLDGRIRDRFHAEPIVQATELLLQERMPRGVPVTRPPARHMKRPPTVHHLFPEMQRRFNTPHSRVPRTHLLSNGRYSVMVTGAGSGYSRWGDIDVTRWREDATCDGWGSYIFLRDMRTGDVWSTGYQPSAVEPESYEVIFSEDKVEISREDGALTTALVIAVSPEDDGETRRVSLTNHGSRTREIELTSYGEIALAPHADDQAHQAFSKLFIETEFVPGSGALLAKRRPRSAASPEIWAAHLTVVEGETIGDVQYETDRGRFLGRGQGLRTPVAVMDGWPLSNTAGDVIDPIFSLRRRIRLARGETAHVTFWTLAASTREAVMSLVDKHKDAMAYERAITFAWTQAQIQLHHLSIGPGEALLYQRIANRIIYSDPTLRSPPEVIQRGVRSASTLWANGISGDLPIVLVRIDDAGDLDVVRQLLRAYEYWRMKTLAVDLVILNERPASYVQDLQVALETMVRTSRAGQPTDKVKGSIYILRSDLVSADVLGLLQAAARVVILARRGSVSEQVRRIQETPPIVAPVPASRTATVLPEIVQPRQELEFFNGFGGFSADGREYVTVLEKGQWTPAPWINVIANAHFGFHVSTDGSGFTWAINSQQNQITSWSNDPVRDPPGEILYVRDDENGDLWTPTALPIREDSAYVIRHGQGYSSFEHVSHGIALELLQYVPTDDPIKISRLKITNRSGRARRLSVTAYVEWVLGTSRAGSAPYIVTEIDPETGAIFARNPWNNDFGQRIAFVDLGGRQNAWTGDRAEFLGRNGTLAEPLALIGDAKLSNTLGAGLDPCSALQTSLKLRPDASAEIVMLLGETANKEEALALVKRYRQADLDKVLETVRQLWDKTLGAVQVKTPDRAMDIMLNAWLPYQTLACRVWARAGFYQASGAYGFRDQLQDVMALCISRPEIAREHILRAAARQFPEGDVQHWWLPESGRGIRTMISDDMVWLPYVVLHYIEVTGDDAILDETITFLDGPILAENQHEAFFQPGTSAETASLFEHCARGLDRSMAVGVHGLPLMGSGDWNDGMNQIGIGGKGESVWLGWFLHVTMSAFVHVAFTRGDAKRSAAWMLHTAMLKDSLEQSWDGDWYKRAYFDDGTPLGSIQNSECRIDSLAQTWGVISKAAEPVRAQRAMAALEKYLVKRDDGLILLFTPPFSKSNPNPGYIQGYPKGIRENGGQYTHGAVWSILAFAMLGDGDRAAELFSLMNPINHGRSQAAIHKYRVEPYVACGDLYSAQSQVGRGGWSWYSGSAGWMYRVALEEILGFHLQGGSLKIDPCIPKVWPGFQIDFRYRSATYEIAVENPKGVNRGIAIIELDGQPVTDDANPIPLLDDERTHRLRVVLG